MYVDIFVREKVSIGVNSSSWVARDGIDISSSLKVRFRASVPMFVSLSFGVWLEKMKPGLILRIWVYVSFVFSLIRMFFEIVKFRFIVIDWSVSISL